jgi:KipI family sensor histidine kinase inhibitor
VLPYGRDHSLIDLNGPREVSTLHRWLTTSRVTSRPGWSSILVDDGNLQRVHDLVLSATPDCDTADSSRHHTLDVTYDGIDLSNVALQCQLTVDDVVERHTRALYTVVFVGFTRAFAYLSGLDPLLATVPRLATPRVRVPRGSVGIAAGQAGIYPMDSPGGWNVLGSTDVDLFDSTRTPPALLMPSDTVTFRAV